MLTLVLVSSGCTLIATGIALWALGCARTWERCAREWRTVALRGNPRQAVLTQYAPEYHAPRSGRSRG